VAVTGMSGEAYRKAAQEAGFDRFLIKLVNPHVMTDLLRVYAATLEADSRDVDTPGRESLEQMVYLTMK
jgi:hypothetical protein